MLNWVDWVILAIIALSSLISLRRGFLKEALSLFAWAAAVFIAMTFRNDMSTLLVGVVSMPALRELVAFLLLFIATLIIGALVNFTVGQLLKVSGLKFTDRIIGVVFGAARGLVIVLVCVILLPKLGFVTERVSWQQSQLIPHFAVVKEWAYRVAPDLSRFKTVLNFKTASDFKTVPDF